LSNRLWHYFLLLAIGNCLSCGQVAPPRRGAQSGTDGSPGISTATKGARPPRLVGPESRPTSGNQYGTEIHSAHYDIYVDDLDIYVEELNSSTIDTLLEKLYTSLACFFRAEPHERLHVKIFSNQEHYSHAIAGFSPFKRGEADGMYYPADRIAYVLMDPGEPYNARNLLLHECVHQFHLLSRTQNRPPQSAYYIEGLAEHFAMHRWDWGCAEIGKIPTIAGGVDEPAEALKAFLARREPSIRSLAVHGGPIGYDDYANAWGLVGFLSERYPDAYLKWSNALDHLAEPPAAWDTAFGAIADARLSTEYVEWLKAHQEPWTAAEGAWEANNDGTLTGTASDTVIAIAVPKRNVASLSASVERHDHTSSAGLVIGYQSIDHMKLIQVLPDGNVWIYTLKDTKWVSDSDSPVAQIREPKTFTMRAQKQGTRVKVFIDGTEFATLNVPEQSACGFAVTDGTVSFHASFDGIAKP
jgi:hypothetical protein